MDPSRSSLAAGILATGALALSLLAIDVLVAAENPFVFATFAGLCAVGGEPYCSPDTLAAAPLRSSGSYCCSRLPGRCCSAVSPGGLPGRSGAVHGLVYGLVLWTGYLAVVAFGV